MSFDDWRTRLEQAIDAAGRKPRNVSEAANLGPNVVSDTLKPGSNPKVNTVLAICAEVGADPAYIFSGLPVSPALTAFLGSPLAKDPRRLRALLEVLSPENPNPPEVEEP